MFSKREFYRCLKRRKLMLKKLVKASLSLVVIGTGIFTFSLVGNAVQLKKAKNYVDSTYEKNPAYTQILQEQEYELFNSYQNGEINFYEYANSVESTNSLDNKIEILREHSEGDTKIKTQEILKQQQIAYGFGFSGMLLVTIGMCSYLIFSIFNSPNSKKQKLVLTDNYYDVSSEKLLRAMQLLKENKENEEIEEHLDSKE